MGKIYFVKCAFTVGVTLVLCGSLHMAKLTQLKDGMEFDLYLKF